MGYTILTPAFTPQDVREASFLRSFFQVTSAPRLRGCSLPGRPFSDATARPPRASSMELVIYPDPILRKRAEPLKRIDAEVRERVPEMFELMYREGGVGLAAPQVGWSVRLFIMNPLGAESREGELVFINPRLVHAEGEDIDEEGCLSIPEIRARVERNNQVRVECQDLSGELIQREHEGLEARVVQHEYDHLDGILFIKRLVDEAEWLKVKKAVKLLEKEYRQRQKQESRR